MNMIDCATQLNGVSCDTLVKNGITHVGRYLPTSSWKGLTGAEVNAIHSSGLHLITIFEKGSTKESYFLKDQGIQDANEAYSLAKALNQTKGTAIYFTVDFDAQTKDFPNILNYFQGVKDTLKSYKIGCYGKFEVIQLLQSKKLVDYYWQTYAWSRGLHAKGVHLFQYKNDITQYGLNLDMNQIEIDDCGCWVANSENKSATPLMVVRVLQPTDVRVEPSHDSGYIGDIKAPQLYNVWKMYGDWHYIIFDEKTDTCGWVDGNNGQNLYWVNNPALTPQTQKYTVQPNQTLTKISIIFKTTVQNLLTLNPNITNPNKIYAGQTIIVPKI